MNDVKIRIAGALASGIATLVLTACNSSENVTPTTTSAPATNTTTNIAKPTPRPPSRSSTPEARPPRQPPAKPKPVGKVIGPVGYGKVKLGMTFAAAQEAGLVGKNETAPGEFCDHYSLFVGGKRDGLLHITKDRGVEAITPGEVAGTPEGVTAGWRDAEVKTVYSDLNLDQVKQNSRGLVRVPGDTSAIYRLSFRDGIVEDVGLQLADQKCFE